MHSLHGLLLNLKFTCGERGIITYHIKRIYIVLDSNDYQYIIKTRLKCDFIKYPCISQKLGVILGVDIKIAGYESETEYNLST